jgi:hypothetical protein
MAARCIAAQASRARWRRSIPAFRSRWNLALSPFRSDMVTSLLKTAHVLVLE